MDPGHVNFVFRALKAGRQDWSADRDARAWDARSGTTLLGDVVDSWGGHQLGLLRGAGRPAPDPRR